MKKNMIISYLKRNGILNEYIINNYIVFTIIIENIFNKNAEELKVECHRWKICKKEYENIVNIEDYLKNAVEF